MVNPYLSVSELYIEPMLRCIGDIDVMFTASVDLAVTSRYQVPRNLPPMFEDTVYVFEIVDTEFPGYVYLLLVGQMNKRLNTNTYEFMMSTDTNKYMPHVHSHRDFLRRYPSHGPAVIGRSEALLNFDTDVTERDYVISVRCLAWPTQAADWTKRHRNCNWPDDSTINLVVSNGCDLVEVAHHQCRRDEWKRTHQLRLSFSRAETVLLNSWTHKQQVVYHVLRFILHESDLSEMRDINGDKILSRYHLKTLMMWTCELKHSNWWQRSNVVQLTRYAMQLLMECCKFTHCKGYFVSASNTLECIVTQAVINQLEMFTQLTYLTEWLINCYIFKCTERYRMFKHWQFDGMSSDAQLAFIVNSFDVASRRYSLRMSLFNTSVAFEVLCFFFTKYASSLNVSTVKQWNEQLSRIDRRLQPVFIAMFCLYQIPANNVVSEHSFKLMSAVLTNFDNTFTTIETETTTGSLLLKAIRLLQISLTSDNQTTSFILLFLSRISLRKIKHVADSNDYVTRCLGDIYLALLYYVTGRYHSAVRRCHRAIYNSALTTESFCSPNINADVDIVQGLVTLYQHIRDEAFHQPLLPSHGNMFTVQLFAHYLLIMSHSASISYNGNLRSVLMKQYKLCLLNTLNSHSTDLLLFYVLLKKCLVTDKVETRSWSLKPTVAELRRLLLLLSVKHLTVFEKMISHDYSSMCRIVTSDIEATYAYQCGQYEQCLHMSQQNVSSLWHQTQYFYIPAFGYMTEIMNEDIVSWNAIIILSDPRLLSATWISQLTLSLYLITEAKLKLNHSMTSLIGELHRVREFHSRLSVEDDIDRLLMSFVYHRAVMKITRELNKEVRGNLLSGHR